MRRSVLLLVVLVVAAGTWILLGTEPPDAVSVGAVEDGAAGRMESE